MQIAPWCHTSTSRKRKDCLVQGHRPTEFRCGCFHCSAVYFRRRCPKKFRGSDIPLPNHSVASAPKRNVQQIKAQRQTTTVDHLWTWRQNLALERRLRYAKLRGNACVEDIDYSKNRG